MAKMLDNRGTTSKIFQIGRETALKSTDDSLEVVSAQFPAERKDFRASTATFEGLVLPNALLNATDNRFTKNPISNGYELVNGDKRTTLTVDQETGTVESSDGFGIKHSGYVSNAILGFKAPASVSGMKITMPAGFNVNYSDGRDLYDENNNPNGNGGLKSYNSITDAEYTVSVAPTGGDETVSYHALFDETAKELFYVSKDQLYYGIKVPTAEDGYLVRRDSNGNDYYRLIDGAWVKRHIIRVASFDLTDGKTMDNFEPCYPCDLLKLTDYLVADSGGSGGGSQQAAVRSMEIPASVSETASIVLDYACYDKNAMLVLIEHTVVPPATYEISANGKTLTFNTPIPAGMRIDLRWFSNIEVVKVDIPLASDSEFMQGTSDVLAPTVKQVHQYNGTKLPLFYPSRFPWVANNIEWLRADTFSWQSGKVYSAAYAELVSIYNAEGGANETETIGAYTITYKRCANGMKIADASQQNVIMNIFAATGSAFYFILDLGNARFKLPRTKYSLVGYEDGLGNYVSSEAATGNGVKVAGNQSYLYFYMGTYNQSAIDNTAGLNTELFAGKADVDLANLSDVGKGRLGVGLDLMDVVFAPLGIDESKNKRRYLNGQVIIQSQFPAFTSAVKSRMTTMANAFTTEVNWQAEKTNSKLGQCGKFVVDDTAGTIRLPCVVNAQGLVDLALIGGIKSESLPNIKGSLVDDLVNSSQTTSGAFSISNIIADTTGNATGSLIKATLNFNASRSSSTYQDNAPVQQEAVQYPYCIVVNTGVDEAERPINNYQVNNVYSYGMSQYYKGTMNNNSWLKSAGQWNDGTVYTGMYNWLLEQMNAGVSGFVASTATYTDYDFVVNTTDQTFRLPLKNGQEGVFADGVKGNGISIGLSNKDGTNLAMGGQSVATDNGFSYYVATQLAKYGSPVGTDMGVFAAQAANSTFGLTTDPSKSGMIVDKTVPEGWNLYYYIGDTLQNAQLINVARIEETLVNKTNKVQAAEASMPSGKYIDLTLGASGTTYTAPANGWFVLDKAATAANQYAALYNTGNGTTTSTLKGIAQTVIPVASNLGLTIPALKGDIVHLDYTLAGDTVVWRFVYAQGEQ